MTKINKDEADVKSGGQLQQAAYQFTLQVIAKTDEEALSILGRRCSLQILPYDELSSRAPIPVTTLQSLQSTFKKTPLEEWKEHLAGVAAGLRKENEQMVFCNFRLGHNATASPAELDTLRSQLGAAAMAIGQPQFASVKKAKLQLSSRPTKAGTFYQGHQKS
mmetsp:Transcript_17475/g.50014  ORF Transcript_17475/g.50014 Transcript_17475/m.50014 type:complete len:163 (+) Transcript_17475:239-727(+)